MRPRIPPVLTWTQIAALPADVMGPYRLPDGKMMSRDPRTGIWVPSILLDSNWRLANSANSWFDTTSIVKALSLDLTDLKPGWAVGGESALSGGWVAGVPPTSTPIDLNPTVNTESLTYTITGLQAGEKIAVVLRVTPNLSGPVVSNYASLVVGNANANKYAMYVFDNNAYHYTYWAPVTSGAATPHVSGTEYKETVYFSQGDQCEAHWQSPVLEVHTVCRAHWAAASATSYVQLFAAKSVGATAQILVATCVIYIGGL